MKNFKHKILPVIIGSLLLIGCASTPMKKLTTAEMLVAQPNKYAQFKKAEEAMRGASRDKAIQFYRQAAQEGYAPAQFKLASNYHFGYSGFSEDYGKAYYWYQQASNQGHAKAARRIGYMYDRGQGFKRDAEKAFYWHKLAFQRGNKHSQTDMFRLKSELYKRSK